MLSFNSEVTVKLNSAEKTIGLEAVSGFRGEYEYTSSGYSLSSNFHIFCAFRNHLGKLRVVRFAITLYCFPLSVQNSGENKSG
jgi:hypothetical protein